MSVRRICSWRVLGTANILEGEVAGSDAERAFVTGGIRVPVLPSAAIAAGARMVFRPTRESTAGRAA